MSDEGAYLDTAAEAAACRPADQASRVHPLFDAARHVGRRRLHVGGQDHRPAVRAAGARAGTAQGRHAQGRHAGAEDRHPAHLFVDLSIPTSCAQVSGYLTRTGADNVTRPHLRRNGKPRRISRPGPSPLRDMNWHDGSPFTAEDAAWNIKHCLDPGDRLIGGRPHEGLHAQGDRHRQEGRQGQSGDDHRVVGRQCHRGEGSEDAGPQSQGAAGRGAGALLPLSVPDARSARKTASSGVGSNGTEAFELVEIEVGRKAVLKAVDGPRRPSRRDRVHRSRRQSGGQPRRPCSPSRCMASTKPTSSSSISTRRWTTSTM